MAKKEKQSKKSRKAAKQEAAKQEAAKREAARVAQAVRVFAWTFDLLDGADKIDCRDKCDRLLNQLASAFNVPHAAFAMMMIEMGYFDGRLSVEDLDELRNAGMWEATRELCESWRYEWSPSYRQEEVV